MFYLHRNIECTPSYLRYPRHPRLKNEKKAFWHTPRGFQAIQSATSDEIVPSSRFQVQSHQLSFKVHATDEGSICERMLDNCFADVYRSFTPQTPFRMTETA